MPLLDIAESKKITIIASIEEATAKNVDAYAAFTKGSPDDVINAALEYIFSKDKDFAKYREEYATAKPKTALRVKRPTATVAKPTDTSNGTRPTHP
jgi:hypothetical protein